MCEEGRIICLFCGVEAGDDVCEHTVFLAMNDGGVLHLAEPYRDHFMSVAEKLLRDAGELEDDGVEEGEFFPTHIIPDMLEALQIDGLEYRDVYGIPPSGLAIYAGFVDTEK